MLYFLHRLIGFVELAHVQAINQFPAEMYENLPTWDILWNGLSTNYQRDVVKVSSGLVEVAYGLCERIPLSISYNNCFSLSMMSLSSSVFSLLILLLTIFLLIYFMIIWVSHRRQPNYYNSMSEAEQLQEYQRMALWFLDITTPIDEQNLKKLL